MNLRVRALLKPSFRVLLRELMLMISVAIRMKRILSCSIFWRSLAMSIVVKVLIDGERLAYQKIKLSERKPSIKNLMKQLTTGYIDLRGIKLWYLV